MPMIDQDRQRRDRIEQFHHRHGADAVQLKGWWLYSNGAMRELNAYGLLDEPPPNPFERGQLIVRYWEERLRRATDEFKQGKAVLTTKANEAIRWATANTPPPPPTDQDIAVLEALKQAVIQCQQKLEAARQALDPSKPAFIRAREERAEANREHNSSVLATIEAIDI